MRKTSNVYRVLLTMKNELTGKPDKYFLVSYKTYKNGEIFREYVLDNFPQKAHCYRTYNAALMAARKIVEKDFRVLKATVIFNSCECMTISTEEKKGVIK